MLIGEKALNCFVGAWGFINSSLVDIETGALIPDDWAYPVPSGMSLYTPNGFCALIVTANDTTKPELRPTFLDQSDPSSGTDAEWALIGTYSIAGAGPYHLSNVTACGEDGGDEDDCGDVGPQGLVTGEFWTATLPSRIGPFEFTFKFYEDCGVWNLHQDVGGGAERVAWYEKLPDQDVYG